MSWKKTNNFWTINSLKINYYYGIVILIVLFVIINNFVFFPRNILSWDVFGYYMYLPLKFIYNDLRLEHFDTVSAIIEKYNNTSTFYQGLQMPEGHYVMKYSMGLAIIYAPFFFIGHLLALLFGFPADGFSEPYQYSIFIGCLIYTILGIIVLSKVLNYFFNQRISSVLLILIVFSTNYIIQVTMYGQNANPHNILFTNYALILWLTVKWHSTYKWKYSLYLALVCGHTILSRPSEVVCLLIPLLWGIVNSKDIIDKFRLLVIFKFQVLFFFLILITIGSCQFIYWKIITGRFLFYSYGGNAGEGFEFPGIYLLKVLFSFRKGWLIYTPIMFLAIIGFIYLFQTSRKYFYPLIAYVILNLLIVSSWSCWWYAQSFSQRALIPSYPIMAIALGYFLVWVWKQKGIFKAILILVITFFLFLNIFQTYQYHVGIIHGDRMTKEYYCKVFGKTKVTDEDKKLLLVDRDFGNLELFKDTSAYDRKLLSVYSFENGTGNDSLLSYKGRFSYRLDSIKTFSPAFEKPYKNITSKDHIWIRVNAKVYPVYPYKKESLLLIIHFTHNGWPYKYNAYGLNNLIDNEWNNISFDYLSPEVRTKTDSIRIFFWLKDKSIVYFDEIRTDIFEKKE